jgi:dehydrogenase/reductase SDR family member 12
VNPASIIDAALEAPVVTSFTRIGYEVRKRLDDWTPLDDYDLTDRVILLTGATSGLGRAAAEQLARCGATLILNGRGQARNETARAQIVAATGNDAVSTIAADMGDLKQVRALADRVRADHGHLDVLIHNAGALSAERRLTADGIEQTVASQVVGPFLLTTHLLDLLVAAPRPARVLTMSSGGMYSAPLSIAGLEMDDSSYKGADQYARAKRAQVTLNELWAERHPPSEIVFHALHPGWADTPGVEEALPTFRKVVGPFLRTAEQGADSLVWLAADDGEHPGIVGQVLARSAPSIASQARQDPPHRHARTTGRALAAHRDPGGVLDTTPWLDRVSRRRGRRVNRRLAPGCRCRTPCRPKPSLAWGSASSTSTPSTG